MTGFMGKVILDVIIQMNLPINSCQVLGVQTYVNVGPTLPPFADGGFEINIVKILNTSKKTVKNLEKKLTIVTFFQ